MTSDNSSNYPRNDRQSLELRLYQTFVKERSLDSPMKILREFAAEGGSQEVAYQALGEIRKGVQKDDEELEDLVLDTMDFVVGFCSAHMRIRPGSDQR